MKKNQKLVFALLFSFSVSSLAAPNNYLSPNILEQMFSWWNGIINTEQELKAEDFARFFTKDAAIVLNGNEGVRGVNNMPEYFEKIRARSEYIEIVFPFKEQFQTDNKIFTYHTIRSTSNGVEQVSHNMGYAIIKNGKIAYVSLARFTLD